MCRKSIQIKHINVFFYLKGELFISIIHYYYNSNDHINYIIKTNHHVKVKKLIIISHFLFYMETLL